jgi:hypothetical protein
MVQENAAHLRFVHNAVVLLVNPCTVKFSTVTDSAIRDK